MIDVLEKRMREIVDTYTRKDITELEKRYAKEGDKEMRITQPISCFAGFYIKKVIYKDPATIVFWSDNSKTVSKCDKNDVYDEEKGLMLCIIKKLFPSKHLQKFFNMWTTTKELYVEDNAVPSIIENKKYGNHTVTLKEARKKENA